MKQVMRFFWWCCGADRDTLAQYPAEHNKYMSIGATVFFTGLFAGLSGGYACYFVFSGSPGAWFYAPLFGLLWGLAIFNLDRYIVSTIDKSASVGRQLLQTSPRILLAVLIGIVIARPLELKIFDKEIRNQLRVAYLGQQRARIDTLNRAFERKYTLDLANLATLQDERDSLDAAIKAGRQKLWQETFGEKTAETSGIIGYGPYARQRQADLLRQEQYLDSLRAFIRERENFLRQRRQADGVLDEPLLAGPALDSAVNVAGFADRNAALGALKYDADGQRNEANYWSVMFITLLFVVFECLPVLVKLMSTRDAYDVHLRDRRTVDMYRSNRNRDAEIAVIDGGFDARVRKAIEHQNALH